MRIFTVVILLTLASLAVAGCSAPDRNSPPTPKQTTRGEDRGKGDSIGAPGNRDSGGTRNSPENDPNRKNEQENKIDRRK